MITLQPNFRRTPRKGIKMATRICMAVVVQSSALSACIVVSISMEVAVQSSALSACIVVSISMEVSVPSSAISTYVAFSLVLLKEEIQ